MGQNERVRAEFLPFSPPNIGDDEIAGVVDALRSDWITTGPKTKRFEAEFADYVNAPAALALSSCTDALQVALAAHGVGPGDAVFTTTMTFCSTVHVIEHVGAIPILVDVDPATLNMSPAALDAAIDEVVAGGILTPRCIMPVHYAGHPCDMHAIDAIAASRGLHLIEDAAHALPATFDGRMIGDPTVDGGISRSTAFSFYATKNLTTAEGGMLTGSTEFIDEARLWSLHGLNRDAWNRYGKGGSWFYEVVRPGFKCNMTDIQAAIGLVQLQRLESFQQRRRAIVDSYLADLDGLPAVDAPRELPGSVSALHLFPIRLRLDRLTIDRSRFISELGERNIGSSVHFIPVHLHPYYANKYGFAPDDFPIALAEYERLVSLPLNNQMTLEDASDVADAVREICDVFGR